MTSDPKALLVRIANVRDVINMTGPEALDEWGLKYLDSIERQLTRRGTLSVRQVEILERIEKRNSAEAHASRADWNDNYGVEKRRVAKLCANYYIRTGYFRNLADNILNLPDFIPMEKQWSKMCCNKYAMKIREADAPEAAFEVGAMVMLRKTIPGPDAYTLRRWRREHGDLAIVISNTETIISASNGCRRYKLLLTGATEPVLCEERDIKKLPKKMRTPRNN